MAQKKKSTKKVIKKKGGSPSILLHLALAVGLSFVIVLGIRSALASYTRHGVSISVPELTGKKIEVAINELQDVGLNYEVIDSTYNAHAVPGTVADVVPVSGSRVKPERIIFLRIYAQEPMRISLPLLEGQSARNAIARLRGLGFENIQEKIVSSPDIGACLGLTKLDGSPLKVGDLLPKNAIVVVLVGGIVQDTLSLGDLIDGYSSSDSALHTVPSPAITEPEDDPDNWFN